MVRPCVGNEYLSRRAIYKEMRRNPFHPVHVTYIVANNNIPPLWIILDNIKPCRMVVIY